jgi:Xaa-Pro dipeptidase
MYRREFIRTAAAGAAGVSTLLPLAAAGQDNKDQKPEVKAIRDRIKPITKEERRQRVDRARQLMEEKNVDALFLEGGTTLNYFTGISWGRSERLFAMILPKKGDPFFIAPKFEAGRALEQDGDASLYVWEEDESPYAIIEKRFREAELLAHPRRRGATRYFIVERIQQSMPALISSPARPSRRDAGA